MLKALNLINEKKNVTFESKKHKTLKGKMTFTPCEFFSNFYANSPKLDGITRKIFSQAGRKIN